MMSTGLAVRTSFWRSSTGVPLACDDADRRERCVLRGEGVARRLTIMARRSALPGWPGGTESLGQLTEAYLSCLLLAAGWLGGSCSKSPLLRPAAANQSGHHWERPAVSASAAYW